MASLKFSVCLILVLLSFSRHESRSTPPIKERNNSTGSSQSLVKGAEEVLNSGFGNKGTNKTRYKPARSSPGGPDPQHHSKNQ
ncbi:hypothetical protein PVL29_012996 [Vitis rotundifolia]|uniref:Uncharacterized protein n=1 Tax=Vitis rotundifolia TaxID=103349 RepID=A0AA38ZKP3_VITRO|nr:hypothetical protein PVL29_012996 [Vitis rotundifolia]